MYFAAWICPCKFVVQESFNASGVRVGDRLYKCQVGASKGNNRYGFWVVQIGIWPNPGGAVTEARMIPTTTRKLRISMRLGPPREEL